MKLFSNLGVARKLWIANGFAVACMLVIAVLLLQSKATAMVEEKRTATQHVVQVAYSIVQHYHKLTVDGAMSEQQAKQSAMAALRALRYGSQDYVWINDMRPYVLMHPLKPELDGQDAGGIQDPDGKALFVRFADMVRQKGAGFVDYQWPKPGFDTPVRKVSYVQGFAPWGWVIGSGIYVDDVEAAIRADSVRMGIAILAVGACFLLLGARIARAITAPLKQALQLAQRVAAGDLTSRVEAQASDETGALLEALNVMNESLSRLVGEVRTGTLTIATASGQIAAGNADLSQRTEEQAASLEETASSMEELTSTVKQNEDNARKASELAVGASAVAVKGGEVVGQVVQTMSSINESSRKIVEIIAIIDGIAFQTNILALNAAVEAARAGAQGRGFAVVAGEVRGLAQRSAAAAKEIAHLVNDSVVSVEAGSGLVAQAGRTMDQIVMSVKRVTDIMAGIAAATQEQGCGIEQVNQAVAQMDCVTQQNAALVEQAAAAAESMQVEAEGLTRAVSRFKLATEVGAPAPAHVMSNRPSGSSATGAPKKVPTRLLLAVQPA